LRAERECKDGQRAVEVDVTVGSLDEVISEGLGAVVEALVGAEGLHPLALRKARSVRHGEKGRRTRTEKAHLLLSPSNPDNPLAANNLLRDLNASASSGSSSARNDDGVLRLDLADVEESNVGGESSNAESRDGDALRDARRRSAVLESGGWKDEVLRPRAEARNESASTTGTGDGVSKVSKGANKGQNQKR
jgi:hypothetical protein